MTKISVFLVAALAMLATSSALPVSNDNKICVLGICADPVCNPICIGPICGPCRN